MVEPPALIDLCTVFCRNGTHKVPLSRQVAKVQAVLIAAALTRQFLFYSTALGRKSEVICGGRVKHMTTNVTVKLHSTHQRRHLIACVVCQNQQISLFEQRTLRVQKDCKRSMPRLERGVAGILETYRRGTLVPSVGTKLGPAGSILCFARFTIGKN